MKADAFSKVTVKVAILAVAIAIMMIAVSPALAYDGARDSYIPVSTCAGCHATGGLAVVPEWSMTGHASEGSTGATPAANAYPVGRGPSCAGCHAGNYDPTKAQGIATPIPTGSPVPTATPTVYQWPPAIPIWPSPVDNAYTKETFTDDLGGVHTNVAVVGCSACHSNFTPATLPAHVSGGLANATYQDLANPDICGQCHDRYAYNKSAYIVPTPTPSTLANFHPEYPVAFDAFSSALTTQIDVPNPTATPPTTPARYAFWEGGQSKKAHGEGAVQYSEWLQEGHKDALTGLQALAAFMPAAALNSCLECHSADYLIMEEAGKSPLPVAVTPSPVPTDGTLVAKYGITCQACHKPHAEGSTGSTWNEERNPQLLMPQKELCSKCHNAEIPAGSTLEPGAEVHHPMTEMMAGYGAIGVPEDPSPHQGKCVECHMVPTGYENSGERGTSANHVFAIVTPEEAASQTVTVRVAGVDTVKNMPYSSCSTCHGSPDDPLAKNMQGLIEFRQQWIKDKIAAVATELNAAAFRMGYPSFKDAFDAIEAKDPATRSSTETAFLSAETNRQFVLQEGSFGIHNWTYAKATILTAMEQAKTTPWTPYSLTIKASKTKVKKGTSIKLTGGVIPVDWTAPGPMVVLQKKSGGTWKNLTNSAEPVLPAGTYTISYKVAKGTQYLRTMFASTTGRPTGYSSQVKITGTN